MKVHVRRNLLDLVDLSAGGIDERADGRKTKHKRKHLGKIHGRMIQKTPEPVKPEVHRFASLLPEPTLTGQFRQQPRQFAGIYQWPCRKLGAPQHVLVL
jgi:hypothetical protein